MLKRIAWMLGPLALVAILGVTTAGFPSFPTFQGVKIGSGAAANAVNQLRIAPTPGTLGQLEVFGGSSTGVVGFCVADTSNLCANPFPASDATLFWLVNQTLHFSTSAGADIALLNSVSNNNTFNVKTTNTAGQAILEVHDTTTGVGFFCTSDTANACASNVAAHDLSISATTSIDLSAATNGLNYNGVAIGGTKSTAAGWTCSNLTACTITQPAFYRNGGAVTATFFFNGTGTGTACVSLLGSFPAGTSPASQNSAAVMIQQTAAVSTAGTITVSSTGFQVCAPSGQAQGNVFTNAVANLGILTSPTTITYVIN